MDLIYIVWIGGVLDIINNGSMSELIVFGVLTVILLGLTAIFTKMPATNEDWDKTEYRL